MDRSFKINFMRKIIICALGLTLMLACKKEQKADPYSDSPIDATMPVEKEILKEETTTTEELTQPLSYLSNYLGGYARQEKLFTVGVLAQRLQNLERFNYEALLQNYHTETALMIDEKIIHMSGCKQHSCPSNAYDFFIDLENDNINIYYFRNNMLRVYQEKGMIELPEAYAKEMEVKKSNAGIGSTDGIESNYEL